MQTEDVEEEILSQALVVDENDNDFDLNIPPTSGNEYLRRVRQEAKGCPQVVVASLDSASFNSKQTVKYKEPSGCLPAPRGLAPSAAWQKVQIGDFAELRQKLLRFRAMLSKGELKLKKPCLPCANDAESWCRLCFGRLKLKHDPSDSSNVEPMIQGNGGPDLSLAEYDIKDQPSTSENSMQGTQPLLSIILFMDQHSVIKVLEYHINWLEATGFTSHQGRWFYALLASLQKPLVPEASSLIRDLARLCSNLRASLENAYKSPKEDVYSIDLKPLQESPSDPRLSELNLMICLVAHYFEQTDLAK